LNFPWAAYNYLILFFALLVSFDETSWEMFLKTKNWLTPRLIVASVYILTCGNKSILLILIYYNNLQYHTLSLKKNIYTVKKYIYIYIHIIYNIWFKLKYAKYSLFLIHLTQFISSEGHVSCAGSPDARLNPNLTIRWIFSWAWSRILWMIWVWIPWTTWRS